MCARDLRHGSTLYTDALAENHTAGLAELVEKWGRRKNPDGNYFFVLVCGTNATAASPVSSRKVNDSCR
jgi:hypothetical protein